MKGINMKDEVERNVTVEARVAPKPRVVWVLYQHGTSQPKDAKLPDGCRLVETLPLARLTEDHGVAALVRGQLRSLVPVLPHWDAAMERVNANGFLCALGVTCAPLGIRVSEGVLRLVWA